MIYIFLCVVSFLSTPLFASRSVPLEYISGIENKLPANYHKLFAIVDKDSPQYTIVAHELTMDLMFIAEQERKSGNLYTSFSFLKLANFLFPHRGDVSKKYQSIAEQVTLFLNSKSTPCNEYYEIFLRELKSGFPAMMSQIDQSKCEQINKAVRDINADIVALEKRTSDEGAQKSIQIQKQLVSYIGKEELTNAEEEKVLSLLRAAYLGNLEFKGQGFGLTSDGELIVDFELVRKYSVLSYDGFKQTYSNITGKEFSEESPIFKSPIKFTLRLIQNDKITSYPVSISIKYPTFFNIWLNTFNFFSFSGYDRVQIYHQNDPHAVNFSAEKISLGFHDAYNTKKLNRFEIKGVPAEVINSLKKVDMIPAL